MPPRIAAGEGARLSEESPGPGPNAGTPEPVVPDWEGFTRELERIFEQASCERGGEVATYIPQLAQVEPEQFAVAACTVDGRRFALGDAAEPFCLQSCCKPVNYCLALEEHGVEGVHGFVGREPSGRSFNELSLNEEGRAHNPLVNAGAITCCALLQSDQPVSERFDRVARTWERLSGGRRPGFSNATYQSEKRTADRNFALGYMLRESGALPKGTDLVEVLEFYFQCCSLESDAETLATAAAALAGGGVSPITGERVFEPSTVQACLSLMTSCGLYDYSGEWAFRVGLPAKSGVAGAIFVVVPNVMGLCAWSPRLDQHGNSVRALAFYEELVRTFALHPFDDLAGARRDKIDLRRPRPLGP